MSGKLAVVLLSLVLAHSVVSAQQSASAGPSVGTLSAGNVYQNPALGLALKLPGTWQLQEHGVAHGAGAANCTGPLCGDADIDAALVSAGENGRRYRVFLAAWKLASEYRDRTRYPLKWFADIMLPGSLKQSNWEPMGPLSEVQLDGKGAYRLLVHDPGDGEPRAFGFITESRGYVLMLVGSAAKSSDEPTLQAAVEKI